MTVWKVFGDRLRLPARQSPVVLGVVTAGCALGPSTKLQTSSVVVAVTNEGKTAESVTFRVTGPDGETVVAEDDTLPPSVGRSFEAAVPSRHTAEAGSDATADYRVSVTGTTWATEFAWQTASCGEFEFTVTVDDERVVSAGECVRPRR